MTDEQIDAMIGVELDERGLHEEAGPNKGSCIKYQRATGNTSGDSWCMSFQLWAIIQVLGHSRLRLSGSCEEVREDARTKGWITDTPSKGCLFLLIDPENNHAHHTGLVFDNPDLSGFPTIEGNSNTDGSANGTSVVCHHRGSGDDHSTYEYIDLRMVA